MDSDTLKTIIILAISLIIFATLIEWAGYYTSTTENTVYGESATLATTNTCVGTKRAPVNTIIQVNDSSGPCPADRYSVCDNGFKILVNATSGNCSATGGVNMTTGAKTISYTVYKPTGLGAVLEGLLVSILAIVIIAGIYLSYIK
jgi:hypothetical protein